MIVSIDEGAAGEAGWIRETHENEGRRRPGIPGCIEAAEDGENNDRRRTCSRSSTE